MSVMVSENTRLDKDTINSPNNTWEVSKLFKPTADLDEVSQALQIWAQ